MAESEERQAILALYGIIESYIARGWPTVSSFFRTLSAIYVKFPEPLPPLRGRWKGTHATEKHVTIPLGI